MAPLGQLVQEAAFVVAEKEPAVQFVQTAFAVAVQLEATNLPGAHDVQGVHGA